MLPRDPLSSEQRPSFTDLLGKKISVTYKTCNLQSISSLLNAGLKEADSVVINMPLSGLGDAEADAQVGTKLETFQ